jgi:arylsulfatase A-like enzyme
LKTVEISEKGIILYKGKNLEYDKGNVMINKITLGLSVAALAGFEAKAQKVETRPNLLAIIVDQQAADVMSNAGCKWVNTPAMDSLASQGVRFSAAYCSFPLCAPQRAAMLTGQPPFKSFNDPLKYTSIGTWVKNAGYDTVYYGKWHVGKTKMDSPKVAKWSGFDILQHCYDEEIETRSVEYLKKKHKKPFFMVASFTNPHDCCELARKLGGWKKGTKFTKGGLLPNTKIPLSKCPPLPDNFEEPDLMPEVMRNQTPSKGVNWVSIRPTGTWGKAEWRRYLYGYARLVENVDARIGRILDALKKQKLDKNTVIVFLSDHGDGIGAHRWNQKHCFFEESIRVPFIIADPRGKHGVVDKLLVNTGIDFAPTLLDYAGGNISSYPGVSLKSVVEGKKRPQRKFVVSEFFRHAQELGLKFAPRDSKECQRINKYSEARARMLVSDRYKYFVYDMGKDPEALFDLQNDRGEMKNLVNDPKHKKTLFKYRKKLKDYLKKANDPFKMPTGI